MYLITLEGSVKNFNNYALFNQDTPELWEGEEEEHGEM